MKNFPHSLYFLTFPNGKIYIGLAKNFTMRMHGHKCSSKKETNLAVYNAIRKFGWESVTKRVVAIGSLEYIASLEVKAIKAFGTLVPCGYNILPGGQISPSICPDVAKRAGLKKRGIPLSDKHKKALSEAWKTRPPVKDETRAKISAAGIGRKLDPDTVKIIADKNKGQKRSEETIQRIKDALKRRAPATSESKIKMSASAKAAWQKRKRSAT